METRETTRLHRWDLVRAEWVLEELPEGVSVMLSADGGESWSVLLQDPDTQAWWTYLAGPEASDPPPGVEPVVLPSIGHHRILIRAVDNPEIETVSGGVIVVM